jgi:hypothetical protein
MILIAAMCWWRHGHWRAGGWLPGAAGEDLEPVRGHAGGGGSTTVRIKEGGGS